MTPEAISVESLKDISVLLDGDIYKLARLLWGRRGPSSQISKSVKSVRYQLARTDPSTIPVASVTWAWNGRATGGILPHNPSRRIAGYEWLC